MRKIEQQLIDAISALYPNNDEILWQIGWDDQNIPAVGLEFFKLESDAEQYAQNLHEKGETDIYLTKLVVESSRPDFEKKDVANNGTPVWTWKLVDGGWE